MQFGRHAMDRSLCSSSTCISANFYVSREGVLFSVKDEMTLTLTSVIFRIRNLLSQGCLRPCEASGTAVEVPTYSLDMEAGTSWASLPDQGLLNSIKVLSQHSSCPEKGLHCQDGNGGCLVLRHCHVLCLFCLAACREVRRLGLPHHTAVATFPGLPGTLHCPASPFSTTWP